MELRVLGPLEIEHAGVAVTITGRHQPRLLAALALGHRRAVPIATLVEVLWGDDPPGTARRQVQNLVAQLRRELAAVGPDPVASLADGYRLDVDGLDIEEFDRLVRHGRELSRSGDVEGAARTLRAALALWRGPALTGLAGQYLAAAAVRLDEQRLAALEERIDADLALGHGTELVAELSELVAAHPYRQRLAGQSMTALHQSQRTAEALDLFQGLKSRLAEDLGIDPGAELRALYTAILRDELPAPAARPTGPPEPAAVVPDQLPVDAGGFTGRDPELSVLDELLIGPDRLAVVSGIGGVGKTALSVHWGWQRADRFPDGKLYINLRGYDPLEPLSPKAALDALLRGLGRPGDRIPVDLDETAALFRSLTAGRRLLVVLDNAGDAEQVRPLLPGGDATVTLVTSRDRLTSLIASHHARPVTLNPLSPSASIALMSTMSHRTDAADALPRIAELCGRLPLALRIAAAQLASQPMRPATDLAEELASPERLDALAIDGDPSADVTAGFDLSFRRLDPDAARLLLLLGLVPGDDVAETLAVALDGRPARQVARTLLRLESACLLEQHRPRRYRLHDLVRDYARRLADDRFSTAEHDATADAVVEWFVANRKKVDALEVDNLIATVRTYAPGHRYWRLAGALYRCGASGLQLGVVLDLLVEMAEVCDRDGSPAELGFVYDALAWTNWLAGDQAATVEACTKAVEVARFESDRMVLEGRISNLGVALSEAGQFREAIRYSQELVESLDVSSDVDLRVNILQNHGSRLRRLGRYVESESFLLESLAVKHREDEFLVIPTELMLAQLYLDTERYEEARALVTAVSASAPELPMRTHHIARLYNGILHAFHDGQTEEAVAELRRLRHEADRAGTGLLVHETALTLAAILLDRDDTDAAGEVLAELAAVPNPGLVVTSWIHCLDARRQAVTGAPDTARDTATATAAVFAEMPHPRGEAACWRVVARAETALGDRVAARTAADRADAITAALGVPVSARTFYF